MWPQGSRHRRWPPEPSNREYRWRCSFDRSSYPAAPTLQSQLKHKKCRTISHFKTTTIFASLWGVFAAVWFMYVCLTVRLFYSFARRYAHVLGEPQCMCGCVIPSLTSAFSVSKTFCPLMSLWITWWEWRWERPWKTNINAHINTHKHTESDDRYHYKHEVANTVVALCVYFEGILKRRIYLKGCFTAHPK